MGNTTGFSTVYAGTATSLSTNYYLRNFYKGNRDAITSSSRSSYTSNGLTVADSAALRRAIRMLGDFNFDDTDSTNVRESVKAFVSTYNNLLDSASESTDSTIKRNLKSLKSLTSQYSNDLDNIGITVNSDGSLTARDSLLGTASISKFESLFSSDSNYMQKVSSYAKRIQTRSDTLDYSQKAAESAARSAQSQSASTDGESDQTAVASIVAASLGLNTLLPEGIGENVNLLL